MFVQDGLKLNRFRFVAIPTPKEYASRFGFNNARLNYSGDDIAVMNSRKIDTISDMDSLNQYHLNKEYQESLEDLPSDNPSEDA